MIYSLFKSPFIRRENKIKWYLLQIIISQSVDVVRTIYERDSTVDLWFQIDDIKTTFWASLF